jgi:hypothetical protein
MAKASPLPFSLNARRTLATVVLALTGTAQAHGIAGNRFFPGTLNFDDPAVADEFSITTGTAKQPMDDGSYANANNTTISFARLLTDNVSAGFDTGYLRRQWSGVHQDGATGTDLVLKARIVENDLNETLVATSLSYGIPGTGAKRIGANNPATITPSVYFGQGLGALPESLSWLHPFGFAGGVSVEVPTNSTSNNQSYDMSKQQYVIVQTHNVNTVHWGFAIEYSTLYLSDRFQPGKLPKEEPLHQWVPLVEFAFDSPRGQKTTGTVNPGVAYVKDSWQIAAEAVLPINHDSGHGVGANVQLLLFMDDFMPSLFGKPLLSH